MAVKGWTWLERLKMAGYGGKWQEMTGMAGNCWKGLNMYGNDWKFAGFGYYGHK